MSPFCVLAHLVSEPAKDSVMTLPEALVLIGFLGFVAFIFAVTFFTDRWPWDRS